MNYPSELVPGLLSLDIRRSLLGIVFRRQPIERKLFGIFRDFFQERYTPSAASAGSKALDHLAGSGRFRPGCVIYQLTQRNLVATTDNIIRIHEVYPGLGPKQA